jgi:DHA3 family macrolide efflux protein-like MFS transporter
MEVTQPQIPAEPAAAPAPGKLMNRSFLLLWQGQTISQMGNQGFSIAMMLWAMKATGSASVMSLLMFFSLLPGVLLGPFGGTFADRHSRIRIVILSDILAGLAVCALAAAVWTIPERTRLVLGLFFVVAVLLGVIRAFFTPAVSAAIPDLVPAGKLAAANSLNQLSLQASLLLGQGIGGVLYTALGAPLLFLVDGVSYLYAGVCETLIPRDRVVYERKTDVHPFREFVSETGEGFRWVWRQKGLRDFLVLASLINFLSTPMVVLFPFYVDLYLKAGPRWYGFLMASISAGSVIGFILAGTLGLKGKSRMVGILGAMFLYPAFFGVLAVTRSTWVALVAVLLGGITVGLINVYFMTMLQSATPTELRGRVMGLMTTLSLGLMPLGMILGGVVGDLTGKNVPLILSVCVGLAFLVTLLVGMRPACRDFLANG